MLPHKSSPGCLSRAGRIVLAAFGLFLACAVFTRLTSTFNPSAAGPSPRATGPAIVIPTRTPIPVSNAAAPESDEIPAAVSEGQSAFEVMVFGQPASVVSIIDGDTIDILIDNQQYRVRYILMDTPERGAPYYSEATEANRGLVEGQTVYLQKDVSETDRYGRLLRYVYLADGTFVNAELVRQGYAQLATFPPDVTKVDEIRSAQQEAVAAGRGLWVGQAVEEPPTAPPTEPATAVPVLATANRDANLRGGPGTNFPMVGGVAAGQPVDIIAVTPTGDWYQLATGAWIASFLIDNAPTGLAIAQVIPAPPAPPTAVPVFPAGNPTPVPPPTEVVRAPEPVQVVQPGGNCDPSYPDVCIPSPPPDLDCGEIQYRRFSVRGPDPHRLDGDNDGIGCESG